MDPITLSLLGTVAGAVFAGGAAWGGAKKALNGSRERIKIIDSKLDAHIHVTNLSRLEMTDRLARIETRIN